MKRVRFARWGAPAEVAELVDVALPEPAPDQVVVEIEAAPINPSDLVKFEGRYGYKPFQGTLPMDCGAEGAGRVIAAGPAVDRVAVGERVALYWVPGTWGERVVTAAANVIPVPEEVDPLQAAMVVNNGASAWLLLEDPVALGPGDWVVNNAGNSGLGHFLVALARRRGVRTVSVVARGDVAESLADAGGDVVLEDGPDLAERVAEATAGGPVRLALDAIGGAATARLAACLPVGGQVVTYGLLSGEDCRLSPNALIFQQVRLSGFFITAALERRSGAERAALYGELLGLMADGTLRAPVEATWPLDKVHEAIARAQARGRAGKILLAPEGAPAWRPRSTSR